MTIPRFWGDSGGHHTDFVSSSICGRADAKGGGVGKALRGPRTNPPQSPEARLQAEGRQEQLLYVPGTAPSAVGWRRLRPDTGF